MMVLNISFRARVNQNYANTEKKTMHKSSEIFINKHTHFSKKGKLSQCRYFLCLKKENRKGIPFFGCVFFFAFLDRKWLP